MPNRVVNQPHTAKHMPSVFKCPLSGASCQFRMDAHNNRRLRKAQPAVVCTAYMHPSMHLDLFCPKYGTLFENTQTCSVVILCDDGPSGLSSCPEIHQHAVHGQYGTHLCNNHPVWWVPLQANIKHFASQICQQAWGNSYSCRWQPRGC